MFRAAGRVGSDFLSAIAGRGWVNVSPGRVQEKWSVDNSVLDYCIIDNCCWRRFRHEIHQTQQMVEELSSDQLISMKWSLKHIHSVNLESISSFDIRNYNFYVIYIWIVHRLRSIFCLNWHVQQMLSIVLFLQGFQNHPPLVVIQEKSSLSCYTVCYLVQVAN